MTKQRLDKLFALSTVTYHDQGVAHRRIGIFIFVFNVDNGRYTPYPCSSFTPYSNTMEEAYKHSSHYYHGDSYVPVPGYYDRQTE